MRECYRIEDIMPKHDDTQSLYETVAKKHYQKREVFIYFISMIF